MGRNGGSGFGDALLGGLPETGHGEWAFGAEFGFGEIGLQAGTFLVMQF